MKGACWYSSKAPSRLEVISSCFYDLDDLVTDKLYSPPWDARLLTFLLIDAGPWDGHREQ